MNSIFALLFVTVFAVGFEKGAAIHCFHCNAGIKDEGACGDPFNAEEAKRMGLLKDCSKLSDETPEPAGRNYTMCRKYTQDVEGEYRVVRSCATAGRPGKCIDRTGTAKIKLQYCECTNENPDEPCNKSPQTVFTTSALLGAAVICTFLSALLLQ